MNTIIMDYNHYPGECKMKNNDDDVSLVRWLACSLVRSISLSPFAILFRDRVRCVFPPEASSNSSSSALLLPDFPSPD